jgi:hypothetical protein
MKTSTDLSTESVDNWLRLNNDGHCVGFRITLCKLLLTL